MRTVRAALVVALAFAACDGDEPSADGQFIALQRDFDGFGAWNVVWRGSAPDDALAHAAGLRTVRVNREPSEVSEPVPVGTIVLKTVEDPDFGDILQIHAMAKRGGSYNPQGIAGWEWFDLALDDDGRPVILWRGEHPPDGECYGCAPGTDPEEAAMLGDCNNCHANTHDGLHTLTEWE
jgi:hypothetical protein